MHLPCLAPCRASPCLAFRYRHDYRHRGALAQQSWCKCSLYSGNDFRLCRPFIDELKRAPFLLRPLQGLRRSMGEQFSEERKASKLRASWRAKERIASSLRALPTQRSRARGCDSVQLVKNKLLEPCALCLLKIVSVPLHAPETCSMRRRCHSLPFSGIEGTHCTR